MKLYVWDNVLTDYTPGMMFAIAETPEQAREQLLAVCSYIPKDDLNSPPDIHELDTPYAALCWGGG